MLYGVKVKQGEIIYGKKEGLSVFTFYMVKKIKSEKSEIWKSKIFKKGVEVWCRAGQLR